MEREALEGTGTWPCFSHAPSDEAEPTVRCWPVHKRKQARPGFAAPASSRAPWNGPRSYELSSQCWARRHHPQTHWNRGQVVPAWFPHSQRWSGHAASAQDLLSRSHRGLSLHSRSAASQLPRCTAVGPMHTWNPFKKHQGVIDGESAHREAPEDQKTRFDPTLLPGRRVLLLLVMVCPFGTRPHWSFKTHAIIGNHGWVPTTVNSAVGDVGRDTGAELHLPYSQPGKPLTPLSPLEPGAIPGPPSHGRGLSRKEKCRRVASSRFHRSFAPPPTPRRPTDNPLHHRGHKKITSRPRCRPFKDRAMTHVESKTGYQTWCQRFMSPDTGISVLRPPLKSQQMRIVFLKPEDCPLSMAGARSLPRRQKGFSILVPNHHKTTMWFCRLRGWQTRSGHKALETETGAGTSLLPTLPLLSPRRPGLSRAVLTVGFRALRFPTYLLSCFLFHF